MNTMAATRYAEEADQSAAAAVVGKHLDDPLPGITGTGKRLDAGYLQMYLGTTVFRAVRAQEIR